MACNCKYKKRLLKYKTEYNLKQMVYLDYNATTPVDPRVLGAFDASCRKSWGNPSSLHGMGLIADKGIEEARKIISEYFKVESENTFFCSNGSEAIHAGIYGFIGRNKDLPIITTVIEHSSVLHPLKHLKAAGKNVLYVDINNDGSINIEQLDKTFSQNKGALFIYSPVNHETGVIQNTKEIFNIIKKYDATIFIDGVQAAPRMSPLEWTPYCDLFAVSGHKIYAPKGSAFLHVKYDKRLRPFRFGGYQQNGYFPGTENTHGIAALSEAVKLLKSDFDDDTQRLNVLTNELIMMLKREKIPFYKETPDQSAHGILLISFPWVKEMEDFLFALDSNQICVSRFSACSGRVEGPSKILSLMGVPEERCETSIRISMGRFNKRDDIMQFVKVMKKFHTSGT